MTNDDTPDQRSVEEMRAEILLWAKQLRQQDRNRRLRAGQARPRNKREDDLWATELLRKPKTGRGTEGGAPE